MYGFPVYSPRDYIASPSLSPVGSPALLSPTDATPTKLKRKRPASTKAKPTQPARSPKPRRRPTVSKAKNSKSAKTTIKVVDETVEDKKDAEEAPRDEVAREE